MKYKVLKEAAIHTLMEEDGIPLGHDDVHDYEVFFSDETWARQNPDMVLNQVTREEAFGKIGNMQCKFGEDPVAVLEDDDDVLDFYFDWCRAGGILGA